MNKIASRKLEWISSCNPKNSRIKEELSKKMYDFYSKNEHYFDETDAIESFWQTNIIYKDIVKNIERSESVLEIGCGKAYLLKNFPSLSEQYTGTDFSEELIKQNQVNYPNAKFFIQTDPERFDLKSESFDIVFSVFVLEHVISPNLFLDECSRVLKTGGKLIILCPDYLGKGRMVSQRTGFSAGNALHKIKRKRFLDAVVTLFDSRIKIPLMCKLLQIKNRKSPGFYINTNPIIFYDKFYPDVDAIYLTDENEIVNYLSKHMTAKVKPIEIINESKKLRYIYLTFTKN